MATWSGIPRYCQLFRVKFLSVYKISNIKEDFYFIKYVGASWPTSSNIFLIRDTNGLNIIDTGLNKKEVFKGLLKCIQQKGLEISDIHTILLTHGHTGHIAGVNILKKFCIPRIFLSEESIPETIDPKIQENAVLPFYVREIAPRLKSYDILDELKNSCGEWVLKKVDLLPIRDGDEIKLGKYTFQAIHTPGHDVGLMVFYEPKIKLLLSTDLLQASVPGNALPWYSSSSGGVRAYLKSLNKIQDLDVDEEFPSHGALAGSFRELIGKTRDVILNRESKIIYYLKDGPKTCEQLDVILYSPLTLKFCPWFSSTTEAHLHKLEREGIIKKDDLQYILIGS